MNPGAAAAPPPSAPAPATAASARPPPPLPLPPTTWTGDLACLLPRPSAPPAIPGTAPRTGHAGTWLKAAGPARLRVVAAGAAGAALEVMLPKAPLLRHELAAGSSGGGSPAPPRLLPEQGLLLVPKVGPLGSAPGRKRALLLAPAFSALPWRPSTHTACSTPRLNQGSALFVFRFFDQLECNSFQQCFAALREAAEASAAAAAAEGAAPRHAHAGAAPSGAGAAAAGAGSGPAGETGGVSGGGGAQQSDEEIRAAILGCLADPSFAAYVERVEALWDEVAARVEGDEGPSGAEDMEAEDGPGGG
jgi:hypothetical protein